ncbi:MAG: TIGR01777 family oxidoreductase [Actinomycetota bacterium]|nr:TIGR01777 family oxidoreductase [Actinomycetota bacterium]
MDVLVSGSSGLIGSALREALRDAGHLPVRLVRPSSPREGDTVLWEPKEGRIEGGALEGVQAVAHLAGEPVIGRWTDRKKRRIRASRVAGTRLLAETLAGLQRPPAVMLSASGIHWYGSRGEEVLTEESSPGPGFLAEVVREWEAATGPAEAAGIRVIHLRTAPVLSTEGGLLAAQLLPFRLGLGAKLGSGRQWMSWIALEDHVGAMLYLLNRPDARGPVNLTSPNPVRNVTFARTLGRVLGRPVFLTVPKFAVELVLGADAAEEFAFSSTRVLPARLVDEFAFRFRHPGLEEALRAVLERPKHGRGQS